MPTNDERQPTIQERRDAINQELKEFDKTATERMGNMQMSLNAGRMTKEAADADTKRLEAQRQEILDRKAKLNIEVGGGSYASEKFNSQAKAGDGQDKNAQEHPTSQSREELLRSLEQSAKSSQNEGRGGNDSDKSADSADKNRDKKPPEKGDDDIRK